MCTRFLSPWECPKKDFVLIPVLESVSYSSRVFKPLEVPTIACFSSSLEEKLLKAADLQLGKYKVKLPSLSSL